jgi:hypothetical protein
MKKLAKKTLNKEVRTHNISIADSGAGHCGGNLIWTLQITINLNYFIPFKL